MHLSGFDRFVWAATFCGHIFILLVLFVRRLFRSFPLFTASIVEKVAATVILYVVFNHLSFDAYRNYYWSLGVVDEVLQLLVFYELAAHVFCPTGIWARDVRASFIGLISAAVVVSFFLTWLGQPTAPLLIQTFILRSNFFSALLMSELFVVMIFLAADAGLPFKTHVARIAQGLGAYSIFCLAKDIAVNYAGLSQHANLYEQLSHLRILIYLGCEAFWMVTLWREAPLPRELPPLMRMQIYTLHKQVESDLTRIREWGK
jgi:hypothetical protein